MTFFANAIDKAGKIMYYAGVISQIAQLLQGGAVLDYR